MKATTNKENKKPKAKVSKCLWHVTSANLTIAHSTGTGGRKVNSLAQGHTADLSSTGQGTKVLEEQAGLVYVGHWDQGSAVQ